jgi:hypothetical protein
MKLQTPFCKMQRQTTEIENVELARNATSRGRLGRRLLAGAGAASLMVIAGAGMVLLIRGI